MAKSFVDLSVRDNGFNAKIKGVINTFASLGNAASGAKGQFTKFADSISQVAQSQQLLNSALKGNPYGLLMQAATTAFTKIIEKATEATDAEKRAMEWAEKRAETEQTAAEAIGRSTGDLMAKYEMLRIEWNNLSTDQQKNDWIKQNQNAFKGLNLAVTDVTSAENVFVNNTSKVVAALKARAEAEAYADLYKDQIKKNAMNKATGKYNAQLITDPYYQPTEMEAQLAGFTKENKHENYEYTTRKVMGTDGKYHDYTDWTGRLSQKGLQRLNADRMTGAASRENADRMIADQWAARMAEAQANANALTNNSLFGFKGGGGSGGKGGKGGQPGKSLEDIVREDFEKMLMKSASMGDALKAKDIELPSDAFQAYAASMTQAFEQPLAPLQRLNAEIADLKQALETAPDTETYQFALSEIAKKEKEISEFKGENPMGDISKGAKDTQKSFSAAASSISAVGSALNGIEDPTSKILGLVAQAIASVAAGAGQAISAKDTTSSGWAWIGAAAAIAAEMITIISTIHSATGYATGGVVGGNRYSGDQQWARLNSGETVLTRAQAGLLANQLEGVGLQNLRLQATVTGEQIRMVLNNNGQRTGRGEYIQSNFG